ncbi:MAG: hypothetical protein ACR2OL_02015 [Anderseniella sp.]
MPSYLATAGGLVKLQRPVLEIPAAQWNGARIAGHLWHAYCVGLTNPPDMALFEQEKTFPLLIMVKK